MTTSSQSLTTRYLVFLFLVSLALRVLVGHFALSSMPPVSDAADYSSMASRLVSSFPGEIPYFWPPGLPYLLAVTYAVLGDTLTVARGLVVAIGTANVLLVVLLADRLVTNERAVRLSGWLAAIYPPAVMMSGQTQSHHLVAFLLMLGVYSLLLAIERVRWYYFAISGVALGLGSLTRPSCLSVAVVCLLVIAVLAIRRKGRLGRRLLLGGVVSTVSLLTCILPIMWHNQTLGARWVISTNNERNFFLGNNPYTPHYKTSHLGQRPLAELSPEIQQYLNEIYSRPDARQAMLDEAITYIAHEPAIFVWRTVNRIRFFWGFDYIMSRLIQEHYGFGLAGLFLLLFLEAGGFCLLVFLVIIGLFIREARMNEQDALVVLLVVIGYQLPYMVAFSAGVYHFPVMGLLVPFAALGALSLAEPETRKALRSQSGRVMLAVLIFTMIQVEYGYHSLMLA